MFPEITRETFTRVVTGISIWGVDGAHDTTRAAHAISTDNWIIPTRNEYRRVVGPASACTRWADVLAYRRTLPPPEHRERQSKGKSETS
jgi:hypothetical protein